MCTLEKFEVKSDWFCNIEETTIETHELLLVGSESRRQDLILTVPAATPTGEMVTVTTEHGNGGFVVQRRRNDLKTTSESVL
ncbi:hypothetical protein F2Q68_00006626 [Brassica cretica]|uniref:Uncharacterized protein n=1 Tax=Brassica cretica TaxID=69181 RepID=A0A8S9JNC3_BRACR|nr:hypothetical protein F2Q68_00006626 [Brassica cretica]